MKINVNNRNPMGVVLLCRNKYIEKQISLEDYIKCVVSELSLSGVVAENEKDIDKILTTLEETIKEYGY